MVEQEAEVQRIREESLAQLQALTLRLANLQARLLRLDALGERLTAISDLDDGEFNFNQLPALGGPEVLLEEDNSFESFNLIQEIDKLTQQIEDRQQQLELLENFLSARQIQSDTFLAKT